MKRGGVGKCTLTDTVFPRIGLKLWGRSMCDLLFEGQLLFMSVLEALAHLIVQHRELRVTNS